jgi:hypothetical protein
MYSRRHDIATDNNTDDGQLEESCVQRYTSATRGTPIVEDVMPLVSDSDSDADADVMSINLTRSNCFNSSWSPFSARQSDESFALGTFLTAPQNEAEMTTKCAISEELPVSQPIFANHRQQQSHLQQNDSRSRWLRPFKPKKSYLELLRSIRSKRLLRFIRMRSAAGNLAVEFHVANYVEIGEPTSKYVGPVTWLNCGLVS